MSLITINRNTIAGNAKHGTTNPPIRVAKTPHGGALYGKKVSIKDESGKVVGRLIYSPHEPIMGCGARLVLETVFDAEIEE